MERTSGTALMLKEVERKLFFTDVPKDSGISDEAAEILEGAKTKAGDASNWVSEFYQLVLLRLGMGLKTAEQSLLFTDVPSGALQAVRSAEKDNEMSWVERFQRDCCFADLKDVRVEDTGKIHSDDWKRIQARKDKEDGNASVATSGSSDSEGEWALTEHRVYHTIQRNELDNPQSIKGYLATIAASAACPTECGCA